VGFYFVDDDRLSELSGEQRAMFDGEVRSLIEQSTARVRTLLETHRNELERIKDALLEYETVTGDELKQIMKGEKLNRPKV
jgi:ATP-dependent Zn protease